MPEIECLWECNDGLGESPIWNPTEATLYWCDHVGPRLDPTETREPALRSFNPTTREKRTWTQPEQVGSFAFCRDGDILIATNSGFHRFSPGTDRYAHLADPEPDLPANRLNDGKADRRGRYWCGSMNTQLSEPTGQIHRLDPDGSVHAADPEFRFVCSNGIAFSPDDEQMYFGDTKAGQIFVYDFDLEAGRLSNRRLFFDLRSMAPAIVDGATVDAEGFYWFALNHGGKIIRLDPKGRIDREIVMPIPSPTCVGFGGDDLETLFVTSQQAFVTPEQLAKHPQPGSVFAVHGLGVRGLPEPLFGD